MIGMLQRQLLLWVVSAVLAACVGLLHIKLNHWNNAQPKLQQVILLPSGEFLRIASLGYRELMADVLWLQAIQMMGDRTLTEESGHRLYQILDRITTIDPKFVRAYEAGSQALCMLVVMPEESNRLLEKGMRHNPQQWMLPFLLGINYFFELKDDAKAAEAMAKAARLPGAPERLMRLSAKLFVSAKAPQQAVELLAKAYEETTDDNVRAMLEVRLKESIVERDIQILEEAIRRYQDLYSQRPKQLQDLIHAGVLGALPSEPFGGYYIYESATGELRSSEMKDRMRIPVRRRGEYQ